MAFLMATIASADCIKDLHGEVYCGAGRCMIDSKGTVWRCPHRQPRASAPRSATYNSAITLRRPDLGLVQTGFTADLLIVDGNPLDNLRFLYAFGAMDSADGRIVRKGGIRWTIRDGVVFDNRVLIDEVVEIVRQ